VGAGPVYVPLMRIPALTLSSLVACSGKSGETTGDTSTTDTVDTVGTGDTSDTQTTEPSGACGDPILYDLTVIGTVTSGPGQYAPAAHVVLEDRGWEPGTILGEGFTDEKGVFQLSVVGLTSLENCWGTVLDYVLEADKGVFYGEKDINTNLFNAIEDGSLVADMSAFPLQMEDTSE
jgi:hypothetical protein